MKQYLLTIIAVLAAILLALFSFDTANNQYSTRSYRTYSYNPAPNAWSSAGDGMLSVLQEDNTGSAVAPLTETNATAGNLPTLPEAGSPLGAPPAMLATSAMMELTPVELPPLDAGMVNVTSNVQCTMHNVQLDDGGAGNDVQAGGYRMQLPVPNTECLIAIPYDPSLLPQGFTEDDIQTYVYDRQHRRWVAIQRDSVNEAELLVCSRFRPWEKGLPHTQNDLANPQDALAQVRDMMSFAPQGEGGGDSPLDFINAVLKTPEMPETSAYTPTSIKELKAADPLEGLTLMQPPTANNSGTANLSYPIEIPAGRQGMQPNLALTYSSGGGNGWLGVGWDIPIPSITVETRWGVPRYDQSKESEVYVYEGEQLVTKDGNGDFRAMPHRTNQWTNRSALGNEEQFFPRKNEAYDSIVRHGNGPSNYWWSVTHKNGVTDYYGKKHDTATVNFSSVLCDPNRHNIAQWMLTESVDPSGNWVRYYYSIERSKSVTGASINYGTQVYLDSIVYTGHDSLSGKYSVRFNRHDTPRRDIITNGRYGFREVTASTLCNLEVLYKDTILRRYYFVTENNRESNYKTRLTDLVRMDPPMSSIACDDIFEQRHWSNSGFAPENLESPIYEKNLVRYNFSYFNYPDQDSLYSTVKTISGLVSDGIESAFSSYIVPTTALGSTRGSGANFGGTMSVGVSNKNFVITDFNVGGNFNYGHSSSEGLLTLVDLNGDGLADKVYKQGNRIYYRPQVINVLDSLSFNFGEKIPISGVYDFLFEESHQPSLGVQGSVMAVVAASAGIPTTVSTTSVYFTDINGDGLTDLVTDQGAMFNSLDSNGHPTFIPVNSYRTDPDGGNLNMGQMIVTSATAPCGGIIFDGVADSSMFCNYYYERDYRTDTNAILELFVNPNVIPVGYVDSLFYFYESDPIPLDCGPIIKEPDLDAVRVWVAPFEGRINIASNIKMLPEHSDGFLQSRYADGVRYSVEYNNGCWVDNNLALHAYDTSVIITSSLVHDDTIYVNETYSMSVDKYDILFFRIQSKEGRSYDNVEWKVNIIYDSVQGTDDYGKAKACYYSDSDYVLTGQHLFQAPKKGTVTLSGKLTGNPGANTGKLYISHGPLIDSSIIIVANTDNNISINKDYSVEDSDIVKFEIKGIGGNVDWGRIECQPYLTFQEDPSDQTLSIPDELSCYPPVRLDIHYPDNSDTIVALRKFFGPLYRGWGQFAYKNDSVSVSQPIDVTTLRLPAYLSNPSLTADSATFASAITSALDTTQFHIDTAANTTSITVDLLSSMIDSIFNPLSDNTRWVEMTPDMEHYRWAGFSNTTSVFREGMSNTRPVCEIPVLNGDDYPSDMTVTRELIEYDHPFPVSVDGYPVQTIRKMNVSVMGNGSLSVVADDGVSLSTGNSVSGGSNFIVSDYLDLNGDRYPDLLCKKQVQYTMPWGGIGTKQVLDPENDELCNSNTRSGGATFSGSYPVPKRQAGGNAQKAKITIEGLGGSLMDGTDETSVMYLDMNGDGLPDRVYEDGNVALNKGYGFDIMEMWSAGTPRMGSTVNTSYSLGANFGLEQVSIGGGLGANQSENVTEMQLMDFNGDGLPDQVFKSGNALQVSYNYGNGYWSLQDTIVGVPHISQSHSYSETGNGALTLGFEIPPWVKIQAGIQLSPYNSSFSHDNAQLTDINGDGYPDYVTSNNESSMTVHYNTAGKTNLLKTVTNFTGSTITLDYDMPLSCYEKPQRSWNLASVEVNDPASPLTAARSLTRFSYADPHYNRYERMDFGYGWVKTSQYDTDGNDSLYRYTVEEFENRSFTKRGRKLRDCLYDAANRPFVEHRYFATVYDRDNEATVDTGCVREELYVGHETELALYYEGHSMPSVVTRTDREYDSYRNIVEFSYFEDTTQYSKLFYATIEYATGMSHNLVSLPVRIEVRDANDALLQLRTASYTNSGKLKQLVLYSSPGDSSVCNYTYDDFGCVDTCLLPKNASNQRVKYSYQYDTDNHIYPVRVENVPLSFVSTTEYNYRFGKPIRTTDINGNEMRYKYDYMGRLLEILAPYEADNGVPYTIRMTYIPKNYDRLDIFTPDTMQNYACTFHYDPDHQGNELRTVVLTDGIGRLLQTKKDVEISGQEKILVTGRVIYDCLGRSVTQYHPFTEDLGTEYCYNESVTSGTATTVRYDILDRQTYIKTPLNLVTTMEYGFDTCMGKTCFRTSVTDPMHNTIHTLTGTIGQQLKQIAPGNTVTKFEYDALGRLLRSTDPDNLSTFYTYDMAGRMVQRIHPDAGTDRYHYDAAGNLVSHVNALADSVIYRYNYNQLTAVEYPRYFANNVYYQYGTSANANINAVGKVIQMEDGSGWQTFKYGKLGEVIENIRTFALPLDSRTYTFCMKFSYDSWNRIKSMTYPDREKVSYFYNCGGLLKSVSGTKTNHSYPYIDSIHYNEFELKETVYYGNGTRSIYRYDLLQRLAELTSYTADNEVMQRLGYDYDYVSNITEIYNSAGILANGLGGMYHNRYSYDNLYRLAYSKGNWLGSPNTNYELEMSYNHNGRISRKTLTAGIVTQTPMTNSHNTIGYNNNYFYMNANQSNTLAYIDNNGPQQFFQWDATGNMTYHKNAAVPLERFFCWDEQNRMQGVKDERSLSFYQYDANDDRTYKLTGNYTSQNISGTWYYFYQLDNATLYASPYLVVTRRGYTKHYYAGSERIASKLGNGGLYGLDHPLVEETQLYDKFNANTNHAKKVINECLSTANAMLSSPLTYLYDLISASQEPENGRYFYHPDHLGSSSWITFTDGKAIQHLHYLPYGEDFVNQQLAVVGTMFTFSAKEKDSETGLSYFGSRYYSSDLSIWLSVDPMSDKYPSLSPYTYCADNPVKLVDPNGEAFDTEIDETTQTITIHAVYYTTTKDAVQLKKELDAWKKKGESYSYISDGKEYSIRFNLEIKDFDDVNEAINKFTENKDDGISNYFQINKTVENPNHEKANGINYEGNNMYVAKGQIRSIRHEIGHSLGLGDWNYGLMKSGGAIYGISKNNIISIFESAGIKSLIHNSLGDWNSRQTDPVCTSKTVHNKSGLFKRKHNQR